MIPEQPRPLEQISRPHRTPIMLSQDRDALIGLAGKTKFGLKVKYTRGENCLKLIIFPPNDINVVLAKFGKQPYRPRPSETPRQEGFRVIRPIDLPSRVKSDEITNPFDYPGIPVAYIGEHIAIVYHTDNIDSRTRRAVGNIGYFTIETIEELKRTHIHPSLIGQELGVPEKI